MLHTKRLLSLPSHIHEGAIEFIVTLEKEEID